MLILEIAILEVILILSIIMERRTGNINPIIWTVGGITALIYGILGKGFVSWIESLICLAVTFVMILISYSWLRNAVGGGIIKGLLMCSMFFGRYIIIVIVLIGINIGIAGFLLKQVKKEMDWYGNLLYGTPLLAIAVTITAGIVQLI